jgi:hypothetical protein
MRQNPKLDVEKTIGELGVGEALVSLLDEHGRPGVVERAKIFPPRSKIGPITADERREIVKRSVLYGHYEQAVDRESAYEKLRGRAENKTAPAPAPREAGAPTPGESGVLQDVLFGSTGPRGGHHDGLVQAAAKSAARTVGSQLGRQILRGVLGSILGGKR